MALSPTYGSLAVKSQIAPRSTAGSHERRIEGLAIGAHVLFSFFLCLPVGFPHRGFLTHQAVF
jgi:hypothetical protein